MTDPNSDSQAAAAVDAEQITYPGARAADRTRHVDSFGLEIAVYEWGDRDAPVLLLAHGGFDFAHTYDVFAPMLADAGWRVVAWDQRGHGDSEHAALYSWDADGRDALAVLDSTTDGAVVAVGHSKGASLMMDLIHGLPERFSRFVNIDGMPSSRPQPDVSDHERTRMAAESTAAWLDHRRAVATKTRRPGSLDELARRRGRMNPRLSLEWLRYLVSVGARHDPDGWRWKLDASMRFGGFGPWRPEWSLRRMPKFPRPMLALLGLIAEEMGSALAPDAVQPHLPPGAQLEAFSDTGHFIHIEKPREVADLVLRFLK